MTLRQKAYLSIIVLICIYTFITLVMPIDPALLRRYNLTESRAHTLSASVIIPYAIIWFINVYGFVKLRSYADLIRDNRDGEAFRQIANGLGFLAFRLPIASILSSFLSYYSRTHFTGVARPTVIVNYLSIIMALIGFTMISRGSIKLLSLTNKLPPVIYSMIQSASVALLMLGYVYLAIFNSAQASPSPTNNNGTFFLPNWIVVVTIILPYLYIWYRGFGAAMRIYFYQHNVPGVLYRQALRLLSWGIGVILMASVFLQFMSSQTGRINKLNLAPLLFLVYAILISIAISSILIALGAKKLKKIEEA